MARSTSLKEVANDAQDVASAQLKKLLSEAQDLLSDGDSFVGDKAEAARKKLSTVLSKASNTFPKDADEAIEKGGELVESVSTYVKEKPLQSLAIAAGLLLVGKFLFGSK